MVVRSLLLVGCKIISVVQDREDAYLEFCELPLIKRTVKNGQIET